MTNTHRTVKAAARHQVPHVEQIALEACILLLAFVVAVLAIAA